MYRTNIRRKKEKAGTPIYKWLQEKSPTERKGVLNWGNGTKNGKRNRYKRQLQREETGQDSCCVSVKKQYKRTDLSIIDQQHMMPLIKRERRNLWGKIYYLGLAEFMGATLSQIRVRYPGTPVKKFNIPSSILHSKMKCKIYLIIKHSPGRGSLLAFSYLAGSLSVTFTHQ